MKNSRGLTRFMSTFGGMFYIGKTTHSPHPSMGNTEVYVIASKELSIELTPTEAIQLANDILEKFNQGVKDE